MGQKLWQVYIIDGPQHQYVFIILRVFQLYKIKEKIVAMISVKQFNKREKERTEIYRLTDRQTDRHTHTHTHTQITERKFYHKRLSFLWLLLN